ncbi:MAG: hypothetical protein ACOC7P_01160 [Chloroflexota bacterium]
MKTLNYFLVVKDTGVSRLSLVESQADRPKQTKAKEEATRKMSWFSRNLNWTLVLAWVICAPVGVIASNVARYTLLSTLEINAPILISLIITLICVILVWWATIWVIRQKGRSLLHLFWILLPLGFIAILILKNHNKEEVKEGAR